MTAPGTNKIPKILKPIRREEKLTDGRLTRYSWISDGRIRPIEEGLPLDTSKLPNFSPGVPTAIDRLVSLIVDKPYLEELYRDYGDLIKAHPEIDPRDPDMMTHYEKQFISQYSSEASEILLRNKTVRVKPIGPDGKPTGKATTEIPADAHLYTWGGILPGFNSCVFDEMDVNIPEIKIKPKKFRTGIYGPRPQGEDQSNLIREIHFECLGDEPISKDLPDDSATHPLDLEMPIRSTLPPLTKPPPDNTVKQCIKRFFDPDVGVPFVPADVDNYFPLDLLVPDPPQSVSSHSHDSQSMLSLGLNPLDECDPKSTLLDTSNQDILFTKNKAPFTRKDIATLRAFNSHWDREKLEQQKRNEANLKKRQQLIKQAFNSRQTFETYLKLVEEDRKRCRAGLIGKIPRKYKTKSMWQIAVESTPDDPSSLQRRREFWWRFCKFIKTSGGIKEKSDTQIVHQLRNNLKVQHPINQQLFFDVIHDLPPLALQNVNTLRIVEFLRLMTKVDQDDFLKYLKKAKISSLIYSQTILNSLSRDQQELIDSIIKGSISVPPCE